MSPDTITTKIVSRPEDILPPRITAKLFVTEGGCWETVAFRNDNGYARARFAGTLVYLHRLSYEVVNGQIPAGLQIDHLCRNRACCNPSHLEAVTPQVNSSRSPLVRFNNGCAHQTHCKRGHPFSAENTYLHAGQRLCRECRRAANRRFTSKGSEA